MLGSLPPEALLTNDTDLTINKDSNGAVLESMAPSYKNSGGITGGVGALVVLDAWKNPIIYVPSGGMIVYLGGQANGNWTTNVGTAAYNGGKPFLVKSTDSRPFFASAGRMGISCWEMTTFIPSP